LLQGASTPALAATQVVLPISRLSVQFLDFTALRTVKMEVPDHVDPTIFSDMYVWWKKLPRNIPGPVLPKWTMVSYVPIIYPRSKVTKFMHHRPP
jgi:hypothetical protein